MTRTYRTEKLLFIFTLQFRILKISSLGSLFYHYNKHICPSSISILFSHWVKILDETSASSFPFFLAAALKRKTCTPFFILANISNKIDSCCRSISNQDPSLDLCSKIQYLSLHGILVALQAGVYPC